VFSWMANPVFTTSLTTKLIVSVICAKIINNIRF
jgi:hypothetical protein